MLAEEDLLDRQEQSSAGRTRWPKYTGQCGAPGLSASGLEWVQCTLARGKCSRTTTRSLKLRHPQDWQSGFAA